MKKIENLLEGILGGALMGCAILGAFAIMGAIVEWIACNISPVALVVLFIVFAVVLINLALDNKL